MKKIHKTKNRGYIERCCEKHLKTKLLICEKYGTDETIMKTIDI